MRTSERQKRMHIVAVLVRFQFTNAEIAKVLGVGGGAIMTDRRLLGHCYSSSPSPRTLQRRFPFFLKTYAELTTTRVLADESDLSADVLQHLKWGLEEVLHVREIVAHLRGVEETINMPPALDAKARGYRLLLRDVLWTPNPVVQVADGFWEEYLVGVRQGAASVSLPSSRAALMRQLAQSYCVKTHDCLRPPWSEDIQAMVCRELDELIDEVGSSGKTVLRLTYGLIDGRFYTEKEIGEQTQRSVRLVRQSRDRAVWRIRGWIDMNREQKERLTSLLMSSTALLDAHVASIMRRQETERQRAAAEAAYASGETQLNTTQLMFLVKPIDEIDGLSIRACNCLKNMNLKTFGEVAQKSEVELLKGRNIGRKSLNEIKEILSGQGMEMGMRWNEATWAAFERIQQQ